MITNQDSSHSVGLVQNTDERSHSNMYLVPNRVKFPKVNKFELSEAINNGIISQEKSVKLIKDPNKYTVLLQKIDCNDPLIKQLLMKFNIEAGQVEVLSFNKYFEQYQPEFEQQIQDDEFLFKIARVVKYLEYLTEQYQYVKVVVQAKNQLFQQAKYQHIQEQQMNQTNQSRMNSTNNSIVKNYKPKYFKLDDAFEQDQQKLDFQLSNLSRYLEIERQNKKNKELFMQNLNHNIEKNSMNKQKQLRMTQNKMQKEFQKVRDAQQTHKELKKKQRQEQVDYYKKMLKNGGNQDVFERLEEERRTQASIISNIEMNRTNYMKSVKDFKTHQDFFHQTVGSQYLSAKDNDMNKKGSNKMKKQMSYVDKLKSHNEYQVEQNYQRSIQIEQDKRDDFEDRFIYQKGLKSKQYMTQYNKDMDKVNQKKMGCKQQIQDKVKDNQSYMKKQEKSDQQEKLKRIKNDVEQKERNHQDYLKQVQEKIIQDTNKRQEWFSKNQKVIKKRDSLRYDRLDNKNHNLVVNRMKSNFDQFQLQEKRLHQKHLLLKNKQERDQMLENINRNPLGY